MRSGPSWLAMGTLGRQVAQMRSGPSWLAMGTLGRQVAQVRSGPSWLAMGTLGRVPPNLSHYMVASIICTFRNENW